MEWAQKYSQTSSHKYWAASKEKKKEMREKYHQYLQSDEWKAKRKRFYKRREADANSVGLPQRKSTTRITMRFSTNPSQI